MDNFFGFLGAYYLIPSLIIGMIGFLLGWFLKPSKKQAGDLSIEGEGALKAEADSLRARVLDLEGQLSTCTNDLSDANAKLSVAPVASDMASDVTAKTTEADDTYALEWQNRYLAARVKYLDSRLAELDGDGKAAAKSAPAKKKTAPAKKAAPRAKTEAVAKAKTTAVTKAKPTAAKAKPAAKKSAAKKASPSKPAMKAKATPKKAAPTKAAPAKTTKAKPAAKKTTSAKSKSDAALDGYLEKVRKYDARATRKSVDAIVKYCGIALRSRDGRLVACSDEEELRTVADGFVTKKLGMTTGQMDLVKSVCEEMKGDRMKSRVVFYYLAAKKAKKLSVFK
ncbi:DUF2853 family protein [Algimonas porphyrae]|uniref:DUF2852 domain-containing protein n=1 Tax=Algimonas porphyrae TaxID=1128113 RepID=A0ABQ5UYW9_9PROT|nr:DUF2853 family protein [Algimonas porphyrae]GLQ20338.1 hypothetical protein GCM10007854_12930 [Algimonas porphyrae]